MASGVINGGYYNNNTKIYSYYIEWSSSSNGSEANSSNLTIKWIYKKNKTDPYNAWNGAGSSNVRFNVDGADTGAERADFDLRYAAVGSTQVLRTYTTTIHHNEDGTRQVPIGGTHVTGNAFGTVTISPIWITLDTIPRKTVCPSLSGDIESTYNIALNPASSNFTHSLYVWFGSITGYVNASGNLQSNEYRFSNPNINFTIPSSFYQQFNAKNGIGTLRLSTYDGNNKIGETTANLTANCLESRCRPSITGMVKDVNSITKVLTGNDNKLIKYFSNALINLTLKAAVTNGDTNSSISSKSVDGITFEGTSVTLDKVIKKDFTITVTNSRGFSASVIISASGDLVEYFPPSITIDPYRYPDQTSSQVKLAYKGSFFNKNFGSVENTIIMKWYWKQSTDSDWNLGGTITPSLNSNIINEDIVDCGDNFNYQNAYRFKLEIIDKLTNNGTKEGDVPRGVPIYSHGKEWFQFHTNVYDKNGDLVF